MWYVIQTSPGKEGIVKAQIETTVPRDCYESCRIIYYETERKYQGTWHLEQKKMFPGYLFLITENISDVQIYLKNIPQMIKILGTGDEITPISQTEEMLLHRLSGEESNVEMSCGIQVGEQIRITKGSLKGMESRIRKIDRHKRKALIEIELFGEMRQVEVGLEIVEKN